MSSPRAAIVSAVPPLRIHEVNSRDVSRCGKFVLYWMVAQRRLCSNFALQRAADWSRTLGLPLVVLEPLKCDYRWASDRMHAFVIQGMLDHAKQAVHLPLTYLPYLESSATAGDGLLKSLASQAAVVVTDEFPTFFLPALLRAGARAVDCRMEAVDSNGIVPLRASPKAFARAFDFRRFLQGELRHHWDSFPEDQPFDHLKKSWTPDRSLSPWQFDAIDQPLPKLLESLPIDHTVAVSPISGGSTSARNRLEQFLGRITNYADRRSDVDVEAASGLSPYLHFGHLSAHEIFSCVTRQQNWVPSAASTKTNGSSEGWWGLDRGSESFLDELITWRELGFHFCHHRRDHDRYESLPPWAQQTLQDHASDQRDPCYEFETFDRAQTHDELWNAAQRQLLREGRIHNYLRMLWGKKILEWSASPQAALATMIELNNRYALDGRDPNSYSGIFWVLGRFDRAWGPERQVYGMIRYMSSDNTRRKMSVTNYLRRHAAQPPVQSLFPELD